MHGRTKLLVATALSALLSIAPLAWGFMVEPGLLVVRRIEMRPAGWPSNLAPLKVGVMTDFHIGSPHWSLDELSAAVARLNAERPDIVLLLGDLVIHEVVGGEFVEPEPIAERLAALRAPHGVWAVLGNHDWWYDGSRVAAALRRAGIAMLENEQGRIELAGGAVVIVGIGDDMTRRADVARAFRGLGGAPALVLMHDPASFAEAPTCVCASFAGHTHGGQVWLPFYGAPIIPGRAPRRWAWGLIDEDGRPLYVSAGLGTSILPVRFNQPPELVVATVRAPG